MLIIETLLFNLSPTLPYTITQKIALKLIIVLMNVLKPTEWTHEYTKELNEIKSLVDKN